MVDTWYLSQYDPIRDPDGRAIGMLYVGELEQVYLDNRTRPWPGSSCIILVGMAAAFLVFFLIARGIVRPISGLAQATEQLAAGDLTHRVVVERSDEVGHLSNSFNLMAEQLQKQRRTSRPIIGRWKP